VRRAALVALALLVVACSDDDAATTTAHTTPQTATTTTAATTSPAATTSEATSTTVAPAGWERVVPGGDCQCALGGEFAYWVHRGDPTKVVLYFQGGGACFNADTCRPGSGAYKSSTGAEDDPSLRPAGLLALDDPRNPVAGWSVVFVPYCTGDVFLGAKTTQYAPDVTIYHAGAANARAALAGLAEMFPDTTQLLVTGESAGGVPVPLVAGEAHDVLPNATITALADSAGAYPDVPIVNATIGSFWGTLDAAPPWPEFAGLTPEQYSIPGLFVLAGRHDPAIRFARHDYAFDDTQAFFGALAGFDASNLVQLIDQNEQQILAGGVDVAGYVAPGTGHTVIGRPAFYTESVNGVAFVDWVGDLVAGRPITDVHCEECH